MGRRLCRAQCAEKAREGRICMVYQICESCLDSMLLTSPSHCPRRVGNWDILLVHVYPFLSAQGLC
jgi:hypothetical protein